MLGDATQFMRADQLEEAWRIIAPILETWQSSPPSDFPNYEAGTWGPELAEALIAQGFRLVSGGTDTHVMLVNVASKGLTGKVAEVALDKAGLTVNKNAIPFDTRPPTVTSGIRLGTPALTTRGMREAEMRQVAGLIADVLADVEDANRQARVAGQVRELTAAFPLYQERLLP